ncbi:arginyltransferase [Hyphobacterium marinum]|uniref:Aspartate/glutamate leucyltransferase n=1 Tax=Hyphobacterium marinum TaxID=3116574 RepID=A0ABU7LYQ9_9PROT|nr:arginyltransferase [Hyphobacterium sp. Y6023]MEE2566696.1 arginyltransferase [Hyphobacterium sp. Y6023]
MTHPFSTRQIPFFLTAPGPCPYLPGREERKLFTRLDPGEGPALNDALTHAGFRRSQSVLYRPACEGCHACQSVRIPVSRFEWTRSAKRILKRNANLEREETVAQGTAEQYDLLSRYLDTRHGDGDMAGMSFADYLMMVEDGAQRTDIVEYRDETGRLRAGALIDRLKDGPSLLYSFFDPDDQARSPGRFMILDAVRWARQNGFEHVYLGYWVPGSEKMDYKARYRPVEVLTSSGWRDLEQVTTEDAGTEPGAGQGE